MSKEILLKRGNKAGLPELSYGEPAFVSDEQELYIGTETGNIKLTKNSEVKELETKTNDWVSFRASGGIISGPIQGVEGTNEHRFLEHTGVFNSRNAQTRVVSANVNGYPSIVLGINDLDNTAIKNGLVYLLGDGGSTYTHNYLRPIAASDGTIENRLGSRSYPWNNLYMKNGFLYGTGGSMVMEAYLGKDIILSTSRSTDSRAGQLVFINNDRELCFRATGGTGASKVDLGNPTVPFKDIFIGNCIKTENGYTKLSNELIIQWGEIKLTGTSAQSSNEWPKFPISFPNTCINIVGVASARDANTNPVACNFYIDRHDSSKYHYRISGATNSTATNIQWMAIGY